MCFLTQQPFVRDFTIDQFKIKLLRNSCEAINSDKNVK